MEFATANLLAGKVLTLSALEGVVKNWKNEHQTIVFTNGVFDIVHTGHLTYLSKAKQLGEKLIVAINSDTSVKRLKGEGRPVNSENDRAVLLASLFFVDAVIVFTDDTPLKLINTIKPDILVKGGDYSIPDIVGAQDVIATGGVVKTISFVSGYSSTSIIEKIRTVNNSASTKI